MHNKDLSSAAARLAIVIALWWVAPAWSVPVDAYTFTYAGTFLRDCSAVACGPSTFPPLIDSPQYFEFSHAPGGVELSNPLGTVGSNTTSAAVDTYGRGSLGVFSSSTSRVSASTSTLRLFTYRGSTPRNLSGSGAMSYSQIGPNLGTSFDADPYAMGSAMFANAWIFRFSPGALPFETDASAPAGRCAMNLSSIPNPYSLFDCLPMLAGFELLDSVDIASDGSGLQSASVTFSLQPGESFYVLTWAQALARLGGQLDARHTFEFNFDEPELFEMVSVPEPSAVGLMFLGLAGVGLVRRRQIPLQANHAEPKLTGDFLR